MKPSIFNSKEELMLSRIYEFSVSMSIRVITRWDKLYYQLPSPVYISISEIEFLGCGEIPFQIDLNH